MDHDDPPPLTRDDFDTLEDWLAHCRRGGVDLETAIAGFRGIDAPGFEGALAGAIYGHTPHEFGRAHAGWGRTNKIEVKNYTRAFRAVALANCLGCMMNTTVDITWKTVGLENDILIAKRHIKFLDWGRRWLSRRGQGLKAVWVLERGSRYGVHTHILMHVPDELWNDRRKPDRKTFTEKAEDVLEEIVGTKLLRTADSSTMMIRHRTGEDFYHQWKRLVYMMKGVGKAVSEEQRVALRLSRTSDEGEIMSKRIGISRALDQAEFRRLSLMNDFPPMTLGEAGDWPTDDRYIRWYHQNADRLILPASSANGNIRRKNLEADWDIS